MNMGNNTAKTSENEELDLFEYAKKMGEHIKELRDGINTLTNEEISLMIEQNKVCKTMYERVFAVLVTEQIKRMNQSKEILEGIKDSDPDFIDLIKEVDLTKEEEVKVIDLTKEEEVKVI